LPKPRRLDAQVPGTPRENELSIGIALFGQNAEHLIALSRRAELLGFDNAWLGEHIFVPSQLATKHPYEGRARDPVVGGALHIYDLWAAVGALIGATERLTLSTGVAIAPLRHPLITARAALTSHQMSGGRFRLGLGIGWMPEEFAALDVPFDERAKRTEEAIEILRKLFAGGAAEHRGRFYAFPETEMTKTAVNIPIIIGGTVSSAVQRAALLGDGWYSPFLPLEACSAIRKEIERIRKEAGLSHKPYSYHVRPTGKIDHGLLARYRDEGFENLIVTWDAIASEDPANATLDSKLRTLENFASSIDIGKE
jgi:probable F420-dependent oxidoreductase